MKDECVKKCDNCYFFSSCDKNMIYIQKKIGKVCKNYLNERECFLKKAYFYPEKGTKIVTIDEYGYMHGKRVYEK